MCVAKLNERTLIGRPRFRLQNPARDGPGVSRVRVRGMAFTIPMACHQLLINAVGPRISTCFTPAARITRSGKRSCRCNSGCAATLHGNPTVSRSTISNPLVPRSRPSYTWGSRHPPLCPMLPTERITFAILLPIFRRIFSAIFFSPHILRF